MKIIKLFFLCYLPMVFARDAYFALILLNHEFILLSNGDNCSLTQGDKMLKGESFGKHTIDVVSSASGLDISNVFFSPAKKLKRSNTAMSANEISSNVDKKLAYSKLPSLVKSSDHDNLCIGFFKEEDPDKFGLNEIRKLNSKFSEMKARPDQLQIIEDANFPLCEYTPAVNNKQKCGSYISIDYEGGKFCLHFFYCTIGMVKIYEDASDCLTEKVFDTDCGSGSVGVSHTTSTNIDMRVIPNFRIPEDVCSINGLSVKACSETYKTEKTVAFVHYGSFSEFIWSFDGLITSVPWRNISSYNCTNCEGENCERCARGPPEYLKAFPDRRESCECQLKHMVSDFFYKVGEKHILVTAYVIDTLQVEYEVRSNKPKDNCMNCGVLCASGKLKFKEHEKLKLIRYCTKGTCKDLLPVHELDLPISELLMGRIYDVTLFYGIGKEKTIKVRCNVHELCPTIQCHLCLERYLNPDCYGFLEFLILVVLSVLLAVGCLGCAVLIYLLNKALGILRIPYLILKFICFKCYIWIKYRCLQAKDKTMNKYEQMRLESSATHRIEEEIKSRTVATKKKIPKFYSLTIMVCLINAVDACSNTISVQHSDLKCRSSGGIEICDLENVLEMIAMPTGQQNCFYIKDGNDRPLGKLTIIINSMSLVCNKQSLYWTYTALPKLHKTYECYMVGNCKNDDFCRNFPNDTIYAGLNANLKDKAGVSGCIRVKGGWGASCLLYVDACATYRVEMSNKHGNIYEVFDCPSFDWMVDVTVVSHLNGLEGGADSILSENIILQLGVPHNTELGEFSITSPTMAPIKDLHSCFLQRNGEAISMANCNSREEMVAGKVGELKCPTEEDARKTSSRCFFNTNMFKLSPSSSDIRMSTQVLDILNIHNKNSLPISTKNYNLIKKGDTVLASLNRNADFKLMLVMRDVKLVNKVNIPKCSIQVESLEGCYLCKEGAKIKMIIESDSDAMVSMICESFESPLSIKKGVNTHEVYGLFHKMNVKEKCHVVCTEKIEFIIEGTLIFSKVDGVLVHDYKTMPSVISSATWNLFSGLGWVPWVCGGIVVIIFIFALMMGCKLLKSDKSYIKIA